MRRLFIGVLMSGMLVTGQITVAQDKNVGCGDLCKKVVRLARDEAPSDFVRIRGARDKDSGSEEKWAAELSIGNDCSVSHWITHKGYLYSCIPGSQRFEKFEDAADAFMNLGAELLGALGSEWKPEHGSKSAESMKLEFHNYATHANVHVEASKPMTCNGVEAVKPEFREHMKWLYCAYWLDVSISSHYDNE